MTETFDKINLNVKLNDIIFNIKKIFIVVAIPPIGNIPNFNSTSEIKILAETSNNNYMALSNWHSSALSGYAKNYKVDINSNGIFIAGIFPVDYDFNSYNINVTFSADYIRGDIPLFKLQQLRKEKLKKLNEICQH